MPLRFKSLWKHKSDVSNVILLLWILVGIGLLSLLLPATVRIRQGDWSGFFITIGTGFFLAGAATLVGSVIGFLFGVPKRKPETEENKIQTATEKRQQPISSYQPNTNLEQISDWLTKIIVGVGLVEIRSVIHFFEGIGKYCGPAFGDAPSGEIIATAKAVHYTLVGFIQGFLLAYLWLPGAFARANKKIEEDSPPEIRE